MIVEIVQQVEHLGFRWELPRPTYRESLAKDKYQLLLLKEKLRYQGYVRNNSLGLFMQDLGDFGRSLGLVPESRYLTFHY